MDQKNTVKYLACNQVNSEINSQIYNQLFFQLCYHTPPHIIGKIEGPVAAIINPVYLYVLDQVCYLIKSL